MDFIYIVLVVAIVYVAITRVVNKIMLDNSKMKDFRAKMDELNKRFNEASKRNDMEEMERIYAEQKKLFPMIWDVLKDQLKMMGVILIIFYTTIWVLGYLNPFVKDDIHITLTNISDGVYASTIHLDRKGLWHLNYNIDAKEGHFKGSLSFYVGNEDAVLNLNPSFSSNGFEISVDKDVYKNGDTAKVTVKSSKLKSYSIVADRATYVSFKLPFSVFGINEITGINSLFIIVVIILGLIESFVLRRIFNY